MKEKRTKKGNSKGELAAVRALPAERIDLRDIPEGRDWSAATRGVFYRPMKQQLTLRLDTDVVAWVREHAPGGRGDQAAINRALREYVRRRGRTTRGAG